MRIILLLATVLIIGSPVLSLAQQCGQSYRVRGGETIYDIAARVYGDGEKWSLIYYANQDLLQNDPTSLKAGDSIRIPCLDRGAAGASTAPRDLERGADAELKLLTGGDYAPFTGQALPGGGLITEIVNAAFEAAPYPVTFSLTWEDDWGQHLDPLLSRKEYDVGFPWLRPDCRQDPENFRCRFHFSEPLFEMLILLFVRADGEVRFREDADIAGLTLCRPEGYYTHDLNRPDRQWLDRGMIELVQPASLGECFELLETGDVDGVPVNEFTGRMKVQEMGLGDRVEPIGDWPISLEGLHVLISKTHPRGTTFLYRFNAGLRSLKASERYQAILDRQMSAFWERLAASTPPVPEQPADRPAGEAPTDDTLRLLTASDYKPFTDQSLPNGGLVTEIVDAAMQVNEDVPDAGIAWHNDWSEHLDPLLLEHRYDLGFPWLRPDCEQNPDDFRCSNFLFSKPVFEMLVLLFTDSQRPLRFTEDSDIIGKTLCRPDGYYTHDLDKNGRYWLAENKITLKQPEQVADCFEMLLAGEVDAVALNEFTGHSTINSMGIQDRIQVIGDHPLSIEGLHVLVARSHPDAEGLIQEVNDGLDTLRAEGRYQAIVERHLDRFWGQF